MEKARYSFIVYWQWGKIESQKAYRRPSKCSNNIRTANQHGGSKGSMKNNSFFPSKRSKKGFVKNFTMNNIGHKRNTDDPPRYKSLKDKIREFFEHRKAHSLYIWHPNSWQVHKIIYDRMPFSYLA